MGRLIVDPRPVVPPARNSLYPLPHNYYELSLGEQRVARVHAICRQGTPEEYVHAWRFFREYYLRSLPEGLMYPEWDPSPPCHYQMVYGHARYRYNAHAFPRGFGKTTVVLEENMLLCITRRFWRSLLLLSTDEMCDKRMQQTMAPAMENCERLIEDLRVVPGFEGGLAPKGRNRKWNSHVLKFPNGSVVEAKSINGASLGYRPNSIFPDDVEFDPELQQVKPDLTENYDRMMTNVILPMLGKRGMIAITGTLLSRQCYLYYVVTSDRDPRFGMFNRHIYDAEDDGTGKLLWAERFTREHLDHLRVVLGPAGYNAQLRNRPGDVDAAVFRVDPELNEYTVEGASPEKEQEPLAVKDAWLVSHQRSAVGTNVVVRRPWEDVVPRMYRCVVMDYAVCNSPSSDFIAMACIGIESSREFQGTWWLLDLIIGKWGNNGWVPILLEFARRWRARFVGIESVAGQQSAVDVAQDYARKRGYTERWGLSVLPIEYKSERRMSKEERIVRLKPRFEAGQLRLPRHRKQTGAVRELYHEIEGFTGIKGATQHDDALDAVAMLQYAIRGGGIVPPQEPLEKDYGFDLIQALEGGKNESEQAPGMALVTGIGAANIPIGITQQRIMERFRRAKEHQEQGRASYRGQRRVVL